MCVADKQSNLNNTISYILDPQIVSPTHIFSSSSPLLLLWFLIAPSLSLGSFTCVCISNEQIATLLKAFVPEVYIKQLCIGTSDHSVPTLDQQHNLSHQWPHMTTQRIPLFPRITGQSGWATYWLNPLPDRETEAMTWEMSRLLIHPF
jgi:hypothetical protein